jgi:hypothetical protein
MDKQTQKYLVQSSTDIGHLPTGNHLIPEENGNPTNPLEPNKPTQETKERKGK